MKKAASSFTKSINTLKMVISRSVALILFCFLTAAKANAQYYYKDQLTTLQTIRQFQQYKTQKIHKIKLLSYENDNQPSADFFGEQSINNNYAQTTTIIQSAATGKSELKAFYNSAGQLIKTIDSTDGSSSASEYAYDEKKQPVKITNLSISAGLHKEKEIHTWFFEPNGKPAKMLRIKNDNDTAYVHFVLDENGNVAEENSARNGSPLPSIYYYYDADNRLTDIVTYNNKARRLLPICIFEYDPSGLLRSMMVIPEGSDNYQKWYYEYNSEGLKTRETCYNKRKQLLGKIEYIYK